MSGKTNKTNPVKALVAWSSGKDSALALYEIQKQKLIEVVGLFTTLREDNHEVNIHGVHERFVEEQAQSLGLPLAKIYLPHPCNNVQYEAALSQHLLPYKERGVSHLVFGDLFLADIRKFREAWLKKNGFEGVFPLWMRDTKALAQTIIDLGFKARIVAVDEKQLSRTFIGREFDKNFLSKLPSHVNPCGENGEFHTFVYAGPGFKSESTPLSYFSV